MDRMRTIFQTSILICMTAVLLLTACTDDEAPDARSERQLHLVFASSQYEEEPEGTSRTVTYPSGYELSSSTDDFLSFIADPKENPSSSDVLTRKFNYQTTAGDWQSNVTVLDTEPEYLIYGFMPLDAENTTDEASIALRSGATSYTQGATITIKNLKLMTTKDPCVIVGVKKASNKTDDVTLELGKFGYKFNAEPGSDYVYILLDHIYAQLRFQIKMESKYADLRTIHVKSMALEPLNESDGVLKSLNVNVTVVPNTTGSNPISSVAFGTPTTGGTAYKLVDDTKDPELELTSDYQPAGPYLHVPASSSFLRYRLTTTYDVYDKKGNLIREDCSATNTFTLSALQRGYYHTVQINVNPTYLYVLSDPDLDNPTITIN